jgi:hypothetical protein
MTPSDEDSSTWHPTWTPRHRGNFSAAAALVVELAAEQRLPA